MVSFIPWPVTLQLYLPLALPVSADSDDPFLSLLSSVRPTWHLNFAILIPSWPISSLGLPGWLTPLNCFPTLPLVMSEQSASAWPLFDRQYYLNRITENIPTVMVAEPSDVRRFSFPLYTHVVFLHLPPRSVSFAFIGRARQALSLLIDYACSDK